MLLEAVLGEERRGEVELQVGRPVAAVGAGEDERLADARGEWAAAPEQELGGGRRLLAVEQGMADRRLPDPDDVGVVLEVGADARELDARLDVGL